MENLNKISMNIIALAGEASSECTIGLQSARKGQFKEAEEHFKEAGELITKAHKLQFQLLQDEANEIEYKVTILFVHSQDHLMNAILFKQMAEEILYLHKKIIFYANKK